MHENVWSRETKNKHTTSRLTRSVEEGQSLMSRNLVPVISGIVVLLVMLPRAFRQRPLTGGTVAKNAALVIAACGVSVALQVLVAKIMMNQLVAVPLVLLIPIAFVCLVFYAAAHFWPTAPK